MYVTGLLLGVNRSGSSTVTVNNSLPISLLFHGFPLLLGRLICSPPLFIYGPGKAVYWCPILSNITHVPLPIWQHLKYSCRPSSNIEWTRVTGQRRMTPIPGLCLAWHLYFGSFFHCCTHYVNVSQMLPVLESSHVANLIPFQLAQHVSSIS